MAYIQFLGAAGTVTGSKHLINTSNDGSVPESDTRNNRFTITPPKPQQ